MQATRQTFGAYEVREGRDALRALPGKQQKINISELVNFFDDEGLPAPFCGGYTG